MTTRLQIVMFFADNLTTFSTSSGQIYLKLISETLLA